MGYVLSPALDTAGLGRQRMNALGWRPSSQSDWTARDGVIWDYAAWFSRSPEICRLKTASRQYSVALRTWSAWTVFNGTAGVGLTPTESADSHFGVTLGVSKDGCLNLWWRAHGAEAAMRHWRGTGPGDINVDGSTLDFPIAGISYPKAFNAPDGTLLFMGRQGSAGNDSQECFLEENDDHTWEVITLALMDWPSGGDEESDYMFEPDMDLNGILPCSW